MDYPSILLLVLKLCGLRTLVLLFQAEQHAHASQHQQHSDTAEQQRAEAAGDRQLEALAVDNVGNNITGTCILAIIKYRCFLAYSIVCSNYSAHGQTAQM